MRASHTMQRPLSVVLAGALAAASAAHAAPAGQTRGAHGWYGPGGLQQSPERAADGASGVDAAAAGERWLEPPVTTPRRGQFVAPRDRRVLRGSVDGFGSVHPLGASERRTVMRVRMEDGRLATVDLGPGVEPSGLDLRRGDRVEVRGWSGGIDGRPVLVARRIQMDGGRAMVRRGQVGLDRVRGSGPGTGERAGRGQRVRAAAIGEERAEGVRQFVAGWPETARNAAHDMLEKYGEPDGITADTLVWKEAGPFVRAVVHREQIEHRFPMPHHDTLEQYVRYKVPPDKMDELAEFDGSLTVYRTAGLMSAMCDKEEMNILALNLAHRIVEDELSAEEARREYAETVEKFMEGERPEVTQRLEFDSPRRFEERTNAPDEPAERFRD